MINAADAPTRPLSAFVDVVAVEERRNSADSGSGVAARVDVTVESGVFGGRER
jgi:hypothetical protein